MNDSKKARVIAFYLPQFHPIPENDAWWGKGFTEWTNVGKAKPLFKGHYQPRVPADLGYYDLRMPEIREAQVQMAKEAGVDGFCYWHYWFGNGKRLLERPFNEVLESGKPDFPFCLGWANHSWYAKNWNSDGTTHDKILIEQVYPGLEDAKKHFDFLKDAFNDTRYIKINNRPFLYIFDPVSIPVYYIDKFKEWAVEAGFKNGLYLVGNISHDNVKKNDLLQKGFDAVNYQRTNVIVNDRLSKIGKTGRALNRVLLKIRSLVLNKPPKLFDYKKNYSKLITDEDKLANVIPTIIPQWDHTPRSGWNGSLFINSTPEVFCKHALEGLIAAKNKPEGEQIVLLKSWNEWAEGNYMEPDIKNGKGYIYALKEAIEKSQILSK